MKNKIKNGLIALFIVGIFGCASACALLNPTDSTTPDSSAVENSSFAEITSETSSEMTSENPKEEGASDQPTQPDEGSSEEGGSDSGEGEEDSTPAGEEDSSNGENETSDSSDGTIELPEDKFH